MTPVLWSAMGVAVAAAALHGILGLWRSVDRAHLSFASMMAFLATYFYFTIQAHHATTAGEAVEAVRRQVMAFLGCHACLLVFVRSYTRVEVPRIVMAFFWMGLPVAFVANLAAPNGLMFSRAPQLVSSTLLGEPYFAIVASPPSLLQYVYGVYFTSFLFLGLACALGAFRRGKRNRIATFAAALALSVTTYVVDLIGDSLGATRPHVGELAFAAWALIMSMQLGHDFRVQSSALHHAIIKLQAQAAQLRSIVDTLQALQRQMRTPIDMLESRIVELVPEAPGEEVLLERLRRSVSRLRDCGRSMPDFDATNKRSGSH